MPAATSTAQEEAGPSPVPEPAPGPRALTKGAIDPAGEGSGVVWGGGVHRASLSFPSC